MSLLLFKYYVTLFLFYELQAFPFPISLLFCIYEIYFYSVLNLYKVNPESGSLSNCVDVPRCPSDVPVFLSRHGKVFQGGNANVLHTLLHVQSGENLLYVGDHIFADVLRSKRSLGWRTCLIVPEVERELEVFRNMSAEREELVVMKRQQMELEQQLDDLYLQIDAVSQLQMTESNLAREKKRCQLEAELAELCAEIRRKFAAYDTAFHPRWGQVIFFFFFCTCFCCLLQF